MLNILETYRDSCKNETISKIINKFQNAKNVEEQIITIPEFSAFLNGTSNENVLNVLQILTYLYINSNSKHPVKKSLLRTFNNAKKYKEEIAKEISVQLLEKIRCTKQHNECVNSVNDCFNNFPAGIHAVSLISDEIFSVLNASLKKYLIALSESTCPITVQEIYKNIHNSSRALVAVSQQCNINLILKQNLTDILKTCITILNHPDIYYDTKNNCGIILTIIANIDLENGYLKLLNTCTDTTGHILKWNIGFKDFNDDIIITCIFSGILNTVKSEQLCKCNNSFYDTDIYKITAKLLDISKKSADTPSIVLGVDRTLLLASRALSSLPDKYFIEILPNLLDHIWTQLDHYVDTIRHVSKQILINLVKISLQQNKEQIGDTTNNNSLDLIINSVLNTPIFRNGRYIALTIIGNEVGCKILLLKNPNLITELRDHSEESSITSYITSCYENLMRCHLKETDNEDTWLKLWVFPLTLKLIEDVELNEKCSSYQKLLINAIKLQPSIIKPILSRWSTDNELQLSSLLKCALIARKIGTVLKDDKKWRGMLDYSILELGKCHQNDEIRISCISLIAESRKTTEIFTHWELKYVVNYLHYNINTQLPAVRQRILFLIKKILTRFSESYYAITRNITKLNEKLENISQKEELQQQKTYYEDFIFQLRECVFDSLFPGANFSRRIICLEVLTFLEPIFNDILLILTQPEDKIWNSTKAEALLLCLEDSYESNKQLATNLLRKCPLHYLKLDTMKNTEQFIKNALELSTSIKPADTITAAYMLETSMYSTIINDVLSLLLNTQQSYSSEYLMIKLLVNHLKTQINIGRNSLLKAAGSAPMYGTLFCIRHLMEKYLFSSNVNESYWKDLITEIINICFDVSEIVCPVVNSSSPEGHLPMDHEAVDPNEEVVTAQMLLVCSWRSIKEVSLLLGEITLKSKIVGENQNGFITEQQMLKIGEHFTVLLTETKHRGAFEQAYVGFTKLCTKLWRCKADILHQLPITWLNDIIDAISLENSGQNSKLCATRRSAGVPFMIQAIVASELQSGNNYHFHQCMKKLLQYANHTGDNIEQRTHSMNILRALYRHTQLGEDISPYVAEGIIASITGFSQNTWAERNSATLLFSSLMTRIFGVQRTKDTDSLNIKNKMTARIFFLRYPTLYDFLLKKLQELTADNCEPCKVVALYPILLLLVRLYPASSEEYDSNNQLQDFIPFVRHCAKNKSLKTRELAAKALIPFIQPKNREILLKELFSTLKNKQNKDYIHGTLLQILYLLPTIAKHDYANLIRKEINDSLWLLNCNKSNYCPIVTALYMQIISKIIVRQTDSINLDIFSEISSQDNYVFENHIVGTTIYYREAVNLQLILLIQESNVQRICTFLFEKLEHRHLEVKEFVFNFLICLLKNSNTAVYIDNLEILDQEKFLTNLISEESKIDLIKEIKQNSLKFVEILKYLIKTHSTLLHKAIFVFFNYHENISDLENEMNYLYLLQKYSDDEEISCAIIASFPTILQNGNQNIFLMNLKEILDIMLDFISPRYDFTCRYYIALTLLELKSTIFTENTKCDNLILLWRIIMILLTDNEPIVRNTVSKLANNNPIAEKAREALLVQFIDIMKTISIKKCISLLIFWALTVFDTDYDDEEIEMQIFERGETSTYIEDMCLSKLSAKHLGQLIHCNDISDIPNVFANIIIILKTDDELWNMYQADRNNLITILQEIQQSTLDINKYFNSNNTWNALDIYNKYKIINIMKSILHINILDE